MKRYDIFIITVVLFIVLNQYVFTKDGSDTSSGIKDIFTSKSKAVKSLNSDILSSEVFLNLRDNQFQPDNISNIPVGKKNPFTAQ